MKFSKRPARKDQPFVTARYVGETSCSFRMPFEILHLNRPFKGFDFIVYDLMTTRCFSTLESAKAWVKDNQR